MNNIHRTLRLMVVVLTVCLPVSGISAQKSFALEQTELRAQITSTRHATISAEMTGRIDFLKIREGLRVKKNDVLVRFNCVLLEIKKKKAKIQLSVARNMLKGNKRMAELDAIGSVDLENSRLEVDLAKMDMTYLSAILDQCVIKAPYSGTISEQFVYENEFIQTGTPLFEIQDDKEPRLEFIIPSNWLTWLETGYEFKVRIDDTEKTYPVKLLYTGTKIDALSNSAKAVGLITGEHNELLPGMSGNIKITHPSVNPTR